MVGVVAIDGQEYIVGPLGDDNNAIYEYIH